MDFNGDCIDWAYDIGVDAGAKIETDAADACEG